MKAKNKINSGYTVQMILKKRPQTILLKIKINKSLSLHTSTKMILGINKDSNLKTTIKTKYITSICLNKSNYYNKLIYLLLI